MIRIDRLNPQVLQQVRAPSPVSQHGTRVQANVVSDPNVMHDIAPDGHFKVPTQVNVSNNPQNYYETIAQQIATAIDRHSDPYEFDEQLGLVRNQFRRDPFRDVSKYRQFAKQFSKGSSAYELALLLSLYNDLPDDEKPKLLEFIHRFINHQEAELQAYLNVINVIDAHSAHLDGTELAGVYEEVVTTTQSVMQALGVLAKRVGVQHINTWNQFLTQASVADLNAINVGSDRIHLMVILQELKSFKILNTFLASLEKLKERFLATQEMDTLVSNSFDYIEQPISTLAIIEKWCSASSTQEQILFFQAYKQVYSKLVDEAYKSEDQKQDAITVLQQRIDELVYNEE